MEHTTTLLDIVALLMFAVGIVGGLWQWAEWWGFIPGAVAVGTGSWLAGRGGE